MPVCAANIFLILLTQKVKKTLKGKLKKTTKIGKRQSSGELERNKMNSVCKQDLWRAIHSAPDSHSCVFGDCTVRRFCGGDAIKHSFAKPSSQSCTTDTLMALKDTKATHIQTVRDTTFVTTTSFPHTHQTLHWHPKSPPTALCCLTLSGYRCRRRDKDGLLTTCLTVISFKVSIQF